MSSETPMMKQYAEIKEQSKDSLLFFRLGDFYEMFNEDALIAAHELDLTLTTRDRNAAHGEERVPMCGVPHHSAEAYIARLISKGYKVSICEQVEDPAQAKGIVRREIVRTITPGTIMTMLDESRNNYICAIYKDSAGVGLCFADVSTGEVLVYGAEGVNAVSAALAELSRLCPAEVILSEGAYRCAELLDYVRLSLNALCENGSRRFKPGTGAELLGRIFGDRALLEEERLSQAAGGLLSYLEETQKSLLETLSPPRIIGAAEYMTLDATARRTLELTSSLATGEKRGSLLGVLDFTSTPMGARQLRTDIGQPLYEADTINARLDALEELARGTIVRGELRIALKALPDLERLCARASHGSASARELKSIQAALERLPAVRALLSESVAALLRQLHADIDEMGDVRELLRAALADELPPGAKDSGFIRSGFNPELDRLRSLVSGGKDALLALESAERRRTGIKTLKVSYNRVFGYLIEVSKSYYGMVPPEYVRKQTLSSCERYVTDDLKSLENDILSAQDKMEALELELLIELRSKTAAQSERFRRSSACIARLDVLVSLAEAAVRYNYSRPRVDKSGKLVIKNGRHPVVERAMSEGDFIPNDADLRPAAPIAIITGPNMAGKSTYMRQVALITLMAQMGSFVPAESAEIGVTDRIFTRIGASDDIAGGRSTFMVEMSELAEILKQASYRSLLILDEIGRGTSTFDGMAVARATLEYIAEHKHLGAKTLFATHYHELREMENSYSGVKNYNVQVKKLGGKILFLRKIAPGAADDSYGVEVAALAGLPETLIKRARAHLCELEENEQSKRRRLAGLSGQLGLAGYEHEELLDKLRRTDPDKLSAEEALELLCELKEQALRM